MDELIGRADDEAYFSSPVWKGLKTPVESFVICLIKNKRFTHAIQLRTDHRDKIELRTERGDISTLRAEWKKVLAKQQDHSTVREKRSLFPRRLPLPAHDTLSLDILATPAELRDKNENPEKSTRWGIYLASALGGENKKAVIPPRSDGGTSTWVATPKQLLDAVNAERRECHQTDSTLDEVIVRVADEMFAIKDFGSSVWPDAELFLECLVRKMPFVYPMRMSGGAGGEMEVSSTKEKLREPTHVYTSIDVLDLPWGIPTDGPQVEIDWTSFILSYDFQKNHPIDPATQSRGRLETNHLLPTLQIFDPLVHRKRRTFEVRCPCGVAIPGMNRVTTPVETEFRRQAARSKPGHTAPSA